MAGLLVCLIFSLASLQQIAASHHQTYLHHETNQTLQKLKTLPSHCTQDLDSLILAEHRKLPGQVFYCSFMSIAIDVAEIFVDTAYNGFEAYVAYPSFVEDLKKLKQCVDEPTTEEKAICVAEYLPGVVQAAEVLVGALENYVGEMRMIVPLVVEEVQECWDDSAKVYKTLLESVLDKATTCAN